MRKIANLVFYKFKGETGIQRQACVFYNDGTVSNVSYEKGLELCGELAKARKIRTKEEFKKLINKEIVHVVSAKDFEKNFAKFMSYDNIKKVEIADAIDNQMESVSLDENDKEILKKRAEKTKKQLDQEDLAKLKKRAEEVKKARRELKTKIPEVIVPKTTIAAPVAEVVEPVGKNVADDKEAKVVDLSGFDKVQPINSYGADNNSVLNNVNTVDMPTVPLTQAKQPRVYKAKTDKKSKSIGELFRNNFDNKRKRRNGIMQKVVACAVTFALGLGGYSLAGKLSNEGFMDQAYASGPANTQVADSSETGKDLDNDSLVRGNNEYYNNYTFEQLLEVTTNPVQKRTMNKLGFAIQNFNGTFADAYVEADKDVRAALSFDEIVAIQQAYNDFSKQDIKAIFNGADIKSGDLTRSYKDATLQLMGAHVIETRENPVDMSNLIESEEGKAFYAKYHEMFLACKEATGQEKIDRVHEFYEAVRTDFPITQEVRTEGIAHADSYASIESYKLSVTPMIAAAEMMYQNLEVDNTLNDGEIDFLNDIGLCNYANDKFERIEMITLGACEDDMENPLYEQYRNAIIKMMKDKNQYVIDDAHRDLSRLDAFQDAVNWHFEIVDGYYTGYVYYTTETHTETKTWSTSHTKTWTEVTKEEKEIPEDVKAEIDKEIAKENKKAKEEGYKKAEETQKEMQKEEDKKAETIKEEVKQDEQDFNNKIEEANNQIEENNKDTDTSNDTPVNEKDFGDHNVDFDDQHSDISGNLNDSVENISTDNSDVKTPADLPDPNVTGAEFDKKAPVEAEAPAPKAAPVVEEPEVVVQEAPKATNTKASNEDLVDKYIEDMGKDDDTPKEKVK